MNWSVLPKCVVVLPDKSQTLQVIQCVSLSMVCSYLFSPAMRTAPSSLRWKPSGPPIHHCHWNKQSTRHLGTLQYFAVSLPWQKFLTTKWCQGARYIGMGDNRQSNMFMKMSADCRGRSDHLASDFNHMWDHLDRSSYFYLQAKLQDKDWGLKQEWRDSIWSKQGSCAGTSSLSSSWTRAVDMTSVWKVPNVQKTEAEIWSVYLGCFEYAHPLNSTWTRKHIQNLPKFSVIDFEFRKRDYSSKFGGIPLPNHLLGWPYITSLLNGPTDMAFGSAIPDKVNSFGVANTPVARITWASRSRHFQVANWRVAIGKMAFCKQQSELQLKSKMKQTIQLFIVSRPGKPRNRLPFSL